MRRSTDVALACYPPSWRERYGDELAELAEDGDTVDLLVGAARAWLHPAGERTLQARRVSTISTVHVSWCVAFAGALFYLKAVNDPPLPGLTTGASQPLWGVAKMTFFLGWALVLIGGTGLLARIAIPAARSRDWYVMRPMTPAVVLLVVVVGSIPFVGSYGYGAPSLGAVIAILGWLALGFALVLAGAAGPVLALRRSGLAAATLRLPMLVAAGVTVMAMGLAIATTAQAAVLTHTHPISQIPGEVSVVSDGLTPYTLAMMWGAVALLLGAATTSSVSVGRALRRS